MSTYEIAYGSRYDGKLSTKEIAARVRAEIKALVKAGSLPPDWKFYVRYRGFAGGTSIDVTAQSPVATYLCAPGWVSAGPNERHLDLPIKGEWKSCIIRANDQWHVSRDDAEAPGVAWVRTLLDGLLRSYNYDGSDIQTDYFNVNFYGHVAVTTVGDWRAQYQRQIEGTS